MSELDNGSFSTVAQLNAVTAATNSQDRTAPISRLWTHVRRKFPEIRNATQFYAYDVARASRIAVTSAVSALHQASPTIAANVPPSIRDLGTSVWQSEVHYDPAPSSDSIGLTVDSVELQTVTGTAGGIFLVVRLQGVGFAVFEVGENAVFEWYTDLRKSDETTHVKVVNKDSGILVLSESSKVIDWLGGRVDASQPWKRHVLPPCVASPCGLGLAGGHFLLLDRSFFQIHIASLDDPARMRSVLADASLIFCTSHTLVAYCSLPEESVGNTDFSSKVTETAIQTVAKGVESLTKLLWGTTPQAAAQVQPLGSISLFDTSLGHNIGSFSPHNHAIASMTFCGDGTLLATASNNGTTVNIFQVLRSAKIGSNAETIHITLLCRLSRGVTKAAITSIAFSPLNHFVAVGTALGTCHVFSLPPDVKKKRGSNSCDGCAPQLSAISRVRSAPNFSSVVAPQIAFANSSSSAVSCMMFIASVRCVVAAVHCSAEGLKLQYSSYLDGFKGQQSESSPNDSEIMGETSDADLQQLFCNAAVEWETYERRSPLETFCFDGAALADEEGVVERESCPESDLSHDWDSCVELTEDTAVVRNLHGPPVAVESDSGSQLSDR